MTKNTLEPNVEKVRQEYKNGVPARKLAKRFKVSKQAIYNATSGRSYKNRKGVFKRYQPVTEQERDEMRERHTNGQDIRDIANQMGRTYQVVYYWCVVKAGE